MRVVFLYTTLLVSLASVIAASAQKPAAERDTIPPVVRMAIPYEDSGYVAYYHGAWVEAEATDSSGIAGVRIFVDSVDISGEIISAPYRTRWIADPPPLGIHTVMAVARDSAGNLGSSELWHMNVVEFGDTAVDESSSSFVPQVSVTEVRCESGRVHLRFNLPFDATVHAELCDMSGRILTTTEPKQFGADNGHEITVGTTTLATGRYLYKLTASSRTKRSEATGTVLVTRK